MCFDFPLPSTNKMPFTPEHSLTRVTLSRDSKDERPESRAQTNAMPAGYIRCIEKRAAGVTLQLATGQADETVSHRPFDRPFAHFADLFGQCTYSLRNSDAIQYTSYDREGSFYLQSGAVGSRSAKQLLSATFGSSVDKSTVMLYLDSYPSSKRIAYKELLKKKMFQESVHQLLGLAQADFIQRTHIHIPKSDVQMDSTAERQ